MSDHHTNPGSPDRRVKERRLYDQQRWAYYNQAWPDRRKGDRRTVARKVA